MRRRKPDALEPLDFVNRFQQLYKGSFTVAFRQLMAAIEVYDLTEQGDFLHTIRDQAAHFCHDLVDRTTPFRAACLRNDTKRAMHVASLHDGDERAGLFR